jgi:hypothetical protein
MAKRYANLALVYGIAAMVFGVFYREFTKFSHFSGKTNLSVMHTHYFMLGMFFFLMLMVIEKVLAFSDKGVGKAVVVYQVGLNITGIGFLVRGLTQVWGTELSRGMDASISGTAGIGHILIGGCMVVLLVRIRKAVV